MQTCTVGEVAQKWVMFQRGVLALVMVNHDPPSAVFDCLQFPVGCAVREVCCSDCPITHADDNSQPRCERCFGFVVLCQFQI